LDCRATFPENLIKLGYRDNDDLEISSSSHKQHVSWLKKKVALRSVSWATVWFSFTKTVITYSYDFGFWRSYAASISDDLGSCPLVFQPPQSWNPETSSAHATLHLTQNKDAASLFGFFLFRCTWKIALIVEAIRKNDPKYYC